MIHMEEITIYVLIYKIRDYPENWIVKYSDSYTTLKQIIGYQSVKEKKIGNYYIIKTIEPESLLYKNFKQFKIYTYKEDDYILYPV